MQLPTAEQLQAKITDLEQQMSDPAISRDVPRLKQLSREHTSSQELLRLVQQHERLLTQQQETAQLLESDDEELRQLAVDDAATLERELAATQQQIEEQLIPRDERDDRDIILEIRAGAGGEEASLFAAELYRAYTRYAERVGWKVTLVSAASSEQGGFKEVVAEISGDNVFGKLKFERGVHRVQRVPATEKQGRIHTSTVTVAIMPQAEETEIEIRPEDLRVDTYRASGAGGQHVNKTSSAIRITHLPSGLVVACQEERSQHKNREKAMKLLRSRLLEQQEQERHAKEAQERRQQIGTGDRSEKIRTYNFPQDRITDHRIKASWSNIPAVMEGELDTIFSDLQAAERALLLQRAT